MKESTKLIAKMILDKNKPQPVKPSAMTEGMLDYLNASQSGMPTLLTELNRRAE